MESKYIPDNLHEWLYKLCKRISMACAPFTFYFISISGYLDHNLIHHVHSPWVEDSGGRNIYSSVSDFCYFPQETLELVDVCIKLLWHEFPVSPATCRVHWEHFWGVTCLPSAHAPPVLVNWLPIQLCPDQQCSPSPSCAPHQNGEKLLSQLCSGTKTPIPCHLCPSITLPIQ